MVMAPPGRASSCKLTNTITQLDKHDKRAWGAYLRRIDSCITQLKARGPSRTCNESKEEEEALGDGGTALLLEVLQGRPQVLGELGLSRRLFRVRGRGAEADVLVEVRAVARVERGELQTGESCLSPRLVANSAKVAAPYWNVAGSCKRTATTKPTQSMCS